MYYYNDKYNKNKTSIFYYYISKIKGNNYFFLFCKLLNIDENEPLCSSIQKLVFTTVLCIVKHIELVCDLNKPHNVHF